MRYFYSICFLFLIVFGSKNTFAQQITVRGKVLDSISLQPIPFATVSLWQPDSVLLTGSATDTAGIYTLNAPDTGNLILQVQLVGYDKHRKLLAVPAGQAVLNAAPIYLRGADIALKEVTVQGEKATTSVQLDKQVFTTKQFQNAAGGTSLDLLQRLPSITVNNEGAVALRGNTNFQVMINGKPSARTAADVLAQLPANQIDQVEIITSPSARYDSDGKTGIINIITKKDANLGWSLSGNGLFAGADPARYGGDGTVSYTGRSFNTYLSADYRRYNIDGFRGGIVRTLYRDTLTYLPSEGIRDWKDQQYSVRVGGSYTPNSRSLLNLGYYIGYKQTDRIANLHYTDYIKTGEVLPLYSTNFDQPYRHFYNKNLFSRTGKFQTLSADYAYSFSNKSKLTVIGVYEYSILGGPLRNSDQAESTELVTLKERSDERSPLNAWRLQADWVLPLSKKQRLEIGYQLRRVRHQGDFSFERQNLQTQQWESDPAFADRMDLRQQIHGGYLQLAGESKRFSYNAGLRLEYTDRILTHQAGIAPYKYHALNLFPSLQGLWKFPAAQVLRIGYNRRIDRPTTKAMSPFQNHRHAEAIEIGDPTLRPEITDVLESSYNRSWENFAVTVTAYANRAKDRIFRVNDPYSRIILLRTYTNAGTATSIGSEFSGDWKPLPWWRFYGSGNLYHFKITGTYQGADIRQQSLNYNLNANTTIEITKRLRFQYDISYISRTATSQGVDSDLLLSNAGVRYTLWRGKGSVGLQLTNIFNSNTQTITTKGPTFYSATEYRKYDRVLQLTAGFRINDSGKKVKSTKTEYGEKDF